MEICCISNTPHPQIASNAPRALAITGSLVRRSNTALPIQIGLPLMARSSSATLSSTRLNGGTFSNTMPVMAS